MKSKKALDRLLNKPIKGYEKFHHHTKIASFKSVPFNKWPIQWKRVYYKSYPRLKKIPLSHFNINSKSLKCALKNRKSTHKFSNKKLASSTLSKLLYHSVGFRDKPLGISENRFYPSAGARYPIELYVVSFHTSLANGVYHYYVKNNSLELLTNKPTKIENILFPEVLSQNKNPRCIIILTGVFKRNTLKYGDVGYRYALIEVGHICQNIYLLSSILDIPCCSVTGFKDKGINKLLDIDGVLESPLCTVLL